MTVHLVYPGRTEATTKDLVVTKRVLVVSPFVLLAIVIAFVFGVLWAWWRRRRRRSAAATPGSVQPAA